MRQQLIITIISAIILIFTAILKLLFFPKVSGHTGFYFYSTFLICGILMTIMLLNIFWMRISSKNGRKPHRPAAFWPNRRETFRIIYPAFLQPTLVVDEIDGTAKRQLEFAVVDLSQEGTCFVDDGCLGSMNTFSGQIRFDNGDMISVDGEIIRKKGEHVSVKFRRPIRWSVLLEEQRRLMVNMKLKPRHLSQ